jgi:multiple sugar transport system substrate-binding protein/raffinose/stachyose/melibiose transport system substrate-binding protein
MDRRDSQRRRVARRAAPLAAMVITALTAAGCSTGSVGAGSAAAPASAGPVKSATIKVLVNVTPTLTQSFWNQQVHLFEQKYPQVKVTLENQGGQDLNSYFSTLMSSGNAPDVAEGLGGISTLVKDSVLAAYPKESWITSEASWQQQTVNGGIYAPAAGLQAQSLVFYNKEDFAKAGITAPPTRMAELQSDVTKLKSHGITPFQGGSQFVTGAQLSSLVDPTLFEQDPSWFAHRNADKVTFANSYWKTMLNTYQQWVHGQDFAPGTTSTPYAQSETDFLKGNAAMYVMGSYVTPTIDTTPHSFTAGVFAVPTQDGRPALAVSPTLSYEIMKNSPNSADDVAFVKFMETDTTAVANFLKTDGDYSAVTPPVTYQQSALSTQIQQIVEGNTTLTPCCTGSGSNSAPQDLSNEVTTQVQALFTGSEGPDQIAGTLDSWWSQQQGGAG